MFKKFCGVLGVCFVLAGSAQGEALNLQQGKVYILNFDEEIQNMHSGGSWVDAQILHTLDDDRKQIILSLKADKNGFLQVKTENKLYNYEIISSNKASKELLTIDNPPIGNLDVDVYTGD